MLRKFWQQLPEYWRLMRFHRPIGILLLLWPTLWGLWIAAQGRPPLAMIVIFVTGVVLMRAAGCVINDFADRKWDGRVARTRTRPLATGALSVSAALTLFGFLCLAAASLLLFLPRMVFYYALFGLFLAICYPFMKRCIQIPQLVLGLAFSWGIPMAFAAQRLTVPPVAWWLFSISVLWAVIYDTQYAMADREDDLKIGIKSSAILFGQYDRKIIAGLQLLMCSLLLGLGLYLGMQKWFYVSIFLMAGVMGYQQKRIVGRQPAACLQAFTSNHWIGLIIFLGILFGYC